MTEDLKPTTLSEAEIDDLELDALERHLLDSDCPITPISVHKFTPGMYIRSIGMPKGSTIASFIHTEEHPYVIHSGIAHVRISGDTVKILKGGDAGITKGGTRRVLYIEEDCSWSTFHVLTPEEEEARISGLDEEALVEMIESRIFDVRIAPNSDGKTIYELYEEESGNSLDGRVSEAAKKIIKKRKAVRELCEGKREIEDE